MTNAGPCRGQRDAYLAMLAAGRKARDVSGVGPDDLPDPMGQGLAAFERTAKIIDVALLTIGHNLLGWPTPVVGHGSVTPVASVGRRDRRWPRLL